MSEVLELQVPSSLSDITLRQYQKWVEVVQENGDEEKSEYLDKKLVEVFCNVPSDLIDQIKKKEFDKVLGVLSEAFSADVSNIITKFKMNGVEYGFEPDMENISIGAYIDAESSLIEWENVHIAMAALYRPITFKRMSRGIEQYSILDYDASTNKAQDMLDMPLDVAMSARVFFWTSVNELLKTSLVSLEKEMEKVEDLQRLKTLQENGDGISQLLNWLTESSSTWKKQPLSHYFKH